MNRPNGRTFPRGRLCRAMRTLTSLSGAVVISTFALAHSDAPDAAQALKFGDFYRTPVGDRGLEPTDTLKAADGKQVRLVGWMVAQEDPPLGYFLLTPRPVRMSEHADGDADDLPLNTVLVLLPARWADQGVPHQGGLVELVGQLHVGRSVERDGRVSWVQLQLQERPMPAAPAVSLSSIDNPLTPIATP